MKFLAFVDVHVDTKQWQELAQRAAKPDIDFVVCAGDISWFGRELASFLKLFNALGKMIYVIPGNHEERKGLLGEKMKGLKRCFNFDRQVVEVGGYIFLGYGGGGFAQEDAEFRKVARQWYGDYNGKKIVLVTHGPPYATKLDRLPGRGHVGNKDYRKFIERIKPKLVICGHLHETAGQEDTIGKTKLINPGWEGMVIELK